MLKIYTVLYSFFLSFFVSFLSASTLSVENFADEPIFVFVDYGQKESFVLLDDGEKRIFDSVVAKIKSIIWYIKGSFYELELNQPGVLVGGASIIISDEPEDVTYSAKNYKITPRLAVKSEW